MPEHQFYKANIKLKGEKKFSTTIIGGFNTLLSSMNRSFRQQIIKRTSELNYTIDQVNLTNIYKTFCTTPFH
jgi:hypothetical protein